MMYAIIKLQKKTPRQGHWYAGQSSRRQTSPEGARKSVRMSAMSDPQCRGFVSTIAGRLLGYNICKGKTFPLQVVVVQPSGFFIWEDIIVKKKRAQTAAPRCPYCGSHSVLRSADGIYRNNDKNTMLYVCSRYPVCDSYVRVHPGTKIPMGTMANRQLRALRNEAHRSFDQLFKQSLMGKEDAYHWLAAILAAPLSQAHIGYLGEYYCKQVIEASKQQLENAKGRLNEKNNHIDKCTI